jgi:hypothetical protein
MMDVDGVGRIDPKKKIFSFSICYKSLCTMFPQLWINEIKDKEGKKLRINLLYYNLIKNTNSFI